MKGLSALFYLDWHFLLNVYLLGQLSYSLDVERNARKYRQCGFHLIRGKVHAVQSDFLGFYVIK